MTRPKADEQTVDWAHGKTDDDLLRDAVRNARHRTRRGYHPRLAAVMDAFMLDSSYAHGLCRRFGFDPDEKVRR